MVAFAVVVALPLMFGGKRNFIRFLLGFVLGVLGFVFAMRLPADDFSRLTGIGNCGAEIEVRIIDSSCTGTLIPWLPNPALIKVEVLRLRFSPAEQWHQVSGKTLIRLPEDAPRLSYGDVLTLGGVFLQPEERRKFYRFNGAGQMIAAMDDAAAGFDFKNYLAAQGIRLTFNAREILSSCSPMPSAERVILAARDRILRVMTSGMRSEDNKKLVAALLFGCRQGLDWKDRQGFIRTGTIHVLTVSGFHVGILALVFFWLGRPLPFRLRNLLVPLLILLYVISTGMNPPAVRTLIMIAVWASCRAMLLRTPGLNSVFFSALLILLYNPHYLQDAGFQSSFTVVGFLVASSGRIREWAALPGEFRLWIPGGVNGFRFACSKVCTAMLAGLLSCIVAALASTGITVFYQGFYCPQTILLNFIIIPVVWVIFLAAALKLLLFPLLFFNHILAWVIEISLQTMNGLCHSFDQALAVWSIPFPPWWSLAIFYLALTLLIAGGRNRTMFLALTLILLSIGFWHWQAQTAPARLAVFYGNQGDSPAMVLIAPGGTGVSVVDVPDAAMARDLTNYLRRNGVAKVDRIILTSAVKARAGGLEAFLHNISVKEVDMPDGRNNAVAFETVAAFSSSSSSCTFSIGPENKFSGYCVPEMKITCEPPVMTLDYRNGDRRAQITCRTDPEGDDVWDLSYDRYSCHFEIPRSSNRTVREFILP